MRHEKNVVITGISRGLGKELFRLFNTKGYNVYGVLRNGLEAETLRNELLGNGEIIVADLSKDQAIDTIQHVVGKKPIDLLINNAGISGKSHLIDQIESKEIIDLFNIHCLGVFRTTKALKENFYNADKPVVLNLNSRFGSITRQSIGTYEDITISYSYRIAKAAQNMLTNCLRKEFKDNIMFVSLHPGKMKTDMASKDADIEPEIVANKILEAFENDTFEAESGIVQLDKELIEW